MKVRTPTETFEEICKRLQTKEAFTFARYGDAEILIMAGQMPGRSYRHIQSQELRELLFMSMFIEDKNYLHATTHPRDENFSQGKKARKLTGEICRIVKPEYNFFCQYVFAFPLVESYSRFARFFDLLKDRTVGMVGNEYVITSETVQRFFNISSMVKIPSVQAFSAFNEKKWAVFKMAEQVEIIFLASGSMSAALSGWLWRKGVRKVIIDPGSIVDGLVGRVKTRGWCKCGSGKLKLKDCRERYERDRCNYDGDTKAGYYSKDAE